MLSRFKNSQSLRGVLALTHGLRKTGQPSRQGSHTSEHSKATKMILVQLKCSLQLALRLTSFGGEKNSLKAPLQWKSCAHLSITAVLWAVPDSLGAFTTEQLSLKAQLCCFFRTVSGETENLMATLAFCLPRTAALREKWAKALLFSLLSHCCSFFFLLLLPFSPWDSCWETGLATSTLLLAVHYFQMWFVAPLFAGLDFFFNS